MNKIGVLLYTSLDLRKFEVYDIIFKKTSPFYSKVPFIPTYSSNVAIPLCCIS